MYTELLRMDFIERQQFPHSLWGECYAYVNSLISSASAVSCAPAPQGTAIAWSSRVT